MDCMDWENTSYFLQTVRALMYHIMSFIVKKSTIICFSKNFFLTRIVEGMPKDAVLHRVEV